MGKTGSVRTSPPTPPRPGEGRKISSGSHRDRELISKKRSYGYPDHANLVECSYHAADYPAVLGLVRDRAVEERLDYPGLDDVRELLDVFQNGELIRLWKDQAGRLASYAILNCGETYASLVFEVARGFSISSLGERILAWAEETFRLTVEAPVG